MSEENKQGVPKQEVEQHTQQMFSNASNDQTRQYVDDQIYISQLAQGYFNRITKGLEEQEADKAKAKFVTFCRGIIAEVEAQPPDESGNPAKVTRNGKFTYKQVMDLAEETLFPKKEEPDSEEEEEEVKTKPKTPEPEVVPSNRRGAGDIQPTGKDEEYENYEEMFPRTEEGIKRYVQFRKEFNKDTKTLKGVKSNIDNITERLERFRQDRLNK